MSTEQEGVVTIYNVKPTFGDVPIYVSPFVERARHDGPNAGRMVFKIGGKEYPAVEIRNRENEIMAYESEPGAPIALRTDRAFAYSSGDKFDRSDPKDMLLLNMMMEQGFMPKEDEQVNPSQHRFFLKDKYAEAKFERDTGQLVLAALKAVSEMTESDMRAVAFVQQQDVRSMSRLQIEGYVYGLAKNSPKRIVQLTNERTFKVRAMLNQFINYDILTRTPAGIKRGNEVIALDEDAAVSWLMARDNNAMVQVLYDALVNKMGEGEVDPLPPALQGTSVQESGIAEKTPARTPARVGGDEEEEDDDDEA